MLTETQLHWRCRRGVRELDVLFTRFLQNHYSDLSVEEQKVFQEMLEVQDPIIMDWLFGRYQADSVAMQNLVEKLKGISGLSEP
ncbi:succinate dehydrogenase assembly factor 2 [Arenicella sp. 4NH20-0111]|uniref:FAD assembly factor SdhE n=1 Tax=Arenicella sp. 4NH20-0111 TaxID=3127648 RepID=UPI0033405B69